ncbi:MAG: cytochrome c biogenesis heme-transporting ATPase CcmA [Gammaproteobacteria bacterium]|nr:cytochrome c biogenesis heme-transporting ATPase CcmA [Gammaproteobacteria bacterium]
MSEPVLDISGLRCERDDRELFAGFDLHIGPAEAVQLRGPNGAGKTTLLRCIAGMHPEYEGRIELLGAPVAGERLLFVGHRPGISGLLSAADNLRWHLDLAGWRGADSVVTAALTRVGLTGYDDVPCQQLSAGQQRRVALARLALPTAEVPLWLLDEPFTALDEAGLKLVSGLMADRLAGGGAILFTTHQPAPELPGLSTRWIGAAA